MVNTEKQLQPKRKLWAATHEMKRLSRRDILMSLPVIAASAGVSFLAVNGLHDGLLLANNVSSHIPLIGEWLHGINFDAPIQGLANLTSHIPGAEAAAAAIKGKQQEVIPQLNNFISKEGTLAAEGAVALSVPLRAVNVGMKNLSRRLTHVHEQVEQLKVAGKQSEIPAYAKPLVEGAKGASTALAVSLTLAEVGVEVATLWGSETPWGLNDLIPLGEAIAGKHPLVEKMTLADRLWMLAFSAVPFVPADGLFAIYALMRKKVNPEHFFNAKIHSAKAPARRS